jgi:hypothetical protein
MQTSGTAKTRPVRQRSYVRFCRKRTWSVDQASPISRGEPAIDPDRKPSAYSLPCCRVRLRSDKPAATNFNRLWSGAQVA